MKEEEWEKIEILPFGLSEEEFLRIKRNWIKKRMKETSCSFEQAKKDWEKCFDNTMQKVREKMLEKLSSSGKKKQEKKEKTKIFSVFKKKRTKRK